MTVGVTCLASCPSGLMNSQMKVPSGRHRLVMKLHQALRAERNRGQAGHWSYDLTRHTNLLHAYRHELHALPDPNWRGNYDWMQIRAAGGRTRSSATKHTRAKKQREAASKYGSATLAPQHAD